MNREEEKLLLLQIKSEPELFGKIFDAYYKPIFNYILHRVANYDISRDLAADTFLKAYLHINSFKWKDISVLSWLYRIATNEVNYFHRKNKAAKLTIELLGNQAAMLFEFDDYKTEKQLIDEEMQAKTDYLRACNALKKLDIKYQEVLSLRYFENKQVLEICEILDKKEGTVKSLLSRGLEKLKNEFFIAT